MNDSVRGRRAVAVLLLATLSVLVLAGPARAHIVGASVLSREPTCSPSCSDARWIRFHTTVRLDSCTSSDGGPLCYLQMLAIVWAQVERDGRWTTVAGPKSARNRMVEGMHLNVGIRVACSPGDPASYRSMSRARSIGHGFRPNTPNPNYSLPVVVSC